VKETVKKSDSPGGRLNDPVDGAQAMRRRPVVEVYRGGGSTGLSIPGRGPCIPLHLRRSLG